MSPAHASPPSPVRESDDPAIHRRAPWVVVAGTLVVAGVLLIFEDSDVGLSPAFQPAYLTLVLVGDLLTAALLIGQYRTGGSPRLLVLSWAYLWSAALIVPYALVFAGVVTRTGLPGSVPSSALWLWVVWHVGFVLLAGAALMPWRRSWHRVLGGPECRGRRVLDSVVLILLASVAGALLVSVGSGSIPVIITYRDYTLLTERFGPWLASVAVAGTVAAFVGVLRRRPGWLQLWAFVAVTAGLSDLVVTLLARDRFTVGWYGARALALVAAFALLVAMLHEITALHRRVRGAADLLEQQNRQLIETQALRDHLVAVVSHDLRTPVSGLTGYLELLQDGDLTKRQAEKMLDNSRRLTRNLTLLIEDLLAVATAQHGTLDICPERTDVRHALDEAVAAFPDSDLYVECPPELQAWVDPLRLQQVLANLVGNALKYGAEPVRIRALPGDEVAGHPGPHRVRLEVTDAGAGVPPEFAEHLFERYSRAEGLAARGSGLGLSVVLDLVTAHGGSVAYEPARNTFVILLPEGPTPTSPLTEISPGTIDELAAAALARS